MEVSRYGPQGVFETRWQSALGRSKSTLRQASFEFRAGPKFYCLENVYLPFRAGSTWANVRNARSATRSGGRQRRMRGFNGSCTRLDGMVRTAAENAADRAAALIRHLAARQNIDNMRVRFRRMGFSYDGISWSSPPATALLPWEQEFFLAMTRKRDPGVTAGAVGDWCGPLPGPWLANEAGRGRRVALARDRPWEERQLEQWFPLRHSRPMRELLTGLRPHSPDGRDKSCDGDAAQLVGTKEQSATELTFPPPIARAVSLC